MTVADTVIVDPEPIKPGIPVKKATLGAIALVLVLITFAVALVMSPPSAPPNVAKPQATGDAAPQDAGSKLAIDEELKKARQAIEDDDRLRGVPKSAPGEVADGKPVQPVVAPGTSRESPVPPEVRRDNQNSALFDKGSPKGTTAASRPGAGSGAQNDDFQLEAQVRGAKSLAFDESQPSANTSASAAASLLAGLPGMGATGGGSIAQRALASLPDLIGSANAQAPSASVQSALERVIGSLRTPNAAAQAPSNGNVGWVNEYAAAKDQKTNDSIKSYPTASPYTLHQGKTIPAILGRQINSDLPGEITAYVVTDVYDSMGRGALLIPKGSVLVGRYSSDVKTGQERLLFAFQRIIMPNGQSFDLPAAQGSDLAGASGVTGDVNNHFFKMFSASFFTAWLSDKVSPATTTTSNNGTTTTGSTAGLVLLDVSKTILDRNRNIPPTITVDQGTRINVEVKKDMEFAGPYVGRNN